MQIKNVARNLKRPAVLCVMLLGVLEYLFSEDGLSTRVICRQDLEELGLVSWKEKAETVHIHRITLHSVKIMLKITSFTFLNFL